MRRALLPLGFAALLLAACAPEPAETPAGTPPMGNPPMGGPADSAATAPAAPVGPGVPLPDLLGDPEAVLDRLAPPHREVAEPVANRHVPGQTDTLRTLAYTGLEVDVYEITGGGRLVQEVRLTGPGLRTAEGLGVGSTRAEVEAALGAPGETEEGGVAYSLGEGPDDPTPTALRIAYERGAGGAERVARMAWQYYVD